MCNQPRAIQAMGIRVRRACCLIALISLPVQVPAADDAAAAWDKLAKALQVRELQTLMFAKSSDEGLQKIDAFLQRYPRAKERENVLYLKAYCQWSLYRYQQAAPSYAALLKEFPDTKFRRLARIREAAAYLFSGQAEQALKRLRVLRKEYPDRPEMYGREMAHALSLTGKQIEALEFINEVETDMAVTKPRLLPRMQHHFDKIRMVGEKLPAFTVKDHISGKPITPDTFKGQVVLVDFWATWCRPCVAELPTIQSVFAEHHADGFEVFAVSLDSDQKRLEAAIKQRRMNWWHYYDGKRWKNRLAVEFDVHSVPLNLLVDRKGIVRAVGLRKQALGKWVARLVAE